MLSFDGPIAEEGSRTPRENLLDHFIVEIAAEAYAWNKVSESVCEARQDYSLTAEWLSLCGMLSEQGCGPSQYELES